MNLDDDVSELLPAWVRGWAVSRGLPSPEPVDGGLRVEVGLPHQTVRFVLHTWDDQALAEIDALATPGYWLKVAGEREALRAALPSRWKIDTSNYLMCTSFSPAPAPQTPYAIAVTQEGPMTEAKALAPDGDIAANAFLALAGGIGVIDRVGTAEAHRRLGLGTAVMSVLSKSALDLGVTTGLLVATPEGRALYQTLGWTVCTTISAAYIPIA